MARMQPQNAPRSGEQALRGETDLREMLAHMRPALDQRPYGFTLLAPGAAIPTEPRPFAIMNEDEGVTIVAPLADLAAAGLPHRGEWARITLMVHSALEAVGLTAAVATALAREGISANVVAAWHHDHIFVAWEDRDRAIAALAALAGSGVS